MVLMAIGIQAAIWWGPQPQDCGDTHDSLYLSTHFLSLHHNTGACDPGKPRHSGGASHPSTQGSNTSNTSNIVYNKARVTLESQAMMKRTPVIPLAEAGWKVPILKYSQRQLKYEKGKTCVIARKIKEKPLISNLEVIKTKTLYLHKKGICYFKCTGRGITCQVPCETTYTVSQKVMKVLQKPNLSHGRLHS